MRSKRWRARRSAPDDLEQRCETDGEPARGELTIALAHRLRDAVWGQGFAPPRFDASFRVAAQRVVGEKHTRLALARDGEAFDAILFRHADPLPARIHAVFRPEVNRWQGQEALELVVEHWAPADQLGSRRSCPVRRSRMAGIQRRPAPVGEPGLASRDMPPKPRQTPHLAPLRECDMRAATYVGHL